MLEKQPLEETLFRQLLSTLTKPRGNVSDWPKVLGRMLEARPELAIKLLPNWPLVLVRLIEEEFKLKRTIWYEGESIFIDKDSVDHTTAVSPEKRLTRLLFDRCRKKANGLFVVGDRPYWLITWETPSFGNRVRQCADLLGLSNQGGLVVFECKLENRYAPVTSAIEGLDYLSCLVAEPNFSRFRQEFQVWRKKPRQVIPQGFESTALHVDGPHEVIVLGSPGYYATYRTDLNKKRRSLTGDGWLEFAAACRDMNGGLRIGFAETDFACESASWVKLNHDPPP